jgi:hypothetical protein
VWAKRLTLGSVLLYANRYIVVLGDLGVLAMSNYRMSSKVCHMFLNTDISLKRPIEVNRLAPGVFARNTDIIITVAASTICSARAYSYCHSPSLLVRYIE